MRCPKEGDDGMSPKGRYRLAPGDPIAPTWETWNKTLLGKREIQSH